MARTATFRKSRLCTIGYEGMQLTEFLGILREHGVQYLVDVRELPISRKQGFAKSALKSALDRFGIGYGHFRVLGSPTLLRHQVRKDRDYNSFFRGMHNHLSHPLASRALDDVIEFARERSTCLMCFCADWERCHRRCVVEAILRRGYFEMQHLEKVAEPSRHARAA